MDRKEELLGEVIHLGRQASRARSGRRAFHTLATFLDGATHLSVQKQLEAGEDAILKSLKPLSKEADAALYGEPVDRGARIAPPPANTIF